MNNPINWIALSTRELPPDSIPHIWDYQILIFVTKTELERRAISIIKWLTKFNIQPLKPREIFPEYFELVVNFIDCAVIDDIVNQTVDRSLLNRWVA